jgi:isoleucyl-tRNA synthetase
MALDAGEVAAQLMAEQPVEVEVNGKIYAILPDEVDVHADAKAGLTVAQESAYLAALYTELTPELVDEGLAREFVRRVQDFRKASGLEISDRINLSYQVSEKLAAAVEAHRDYIMGETLTVEMTAQTPPESSLRHEEPFSIEGEDVFLGIKLAK